MPIQVGIAQCEHCGAKVGTLFDEKAPALESRGKKIRQVAARVDYFQEVEDAKERANNSVVLGLCSFFCPGIGFVFGITGVIFSILALKALQRNSVEEGRGQATAGFVIGLLAIIAQVCYAVYIVKSGRLPW
ncbi:MAG TPA: DUF4190 domain-containing protein [Blastocatellia bacterium]|nr:DUF4190 domain-containing protein [Blastocatellia bacterium]